VDALKRRILGLSSYFRSAQESLLPKYNKILGEDYHIIRIPMSNYQFKIYEDARKEERKLEAKSKRKVSSKTEDVFKEPSSTYRIFSRLFCNFVMPDRPMPKVEFNEEEDLEEDLEEREQKAGAKKEKVEKEKVIKEKVEKPDKAWEKIWKKSKRIEENQDMNNEHEGEIEGDEVLDELGGNDYKKRIENAIKHLEEYSWINARGGQGSCWTKEDILARIEQLKDPEAELRKLDRMGESE
jgi:hypothetical protein